MLSSQDIFAVNSYGRALHNGCSSQCIIVAFLDWFQWTILFFFPWKCLPASKFGTSSSAEFSLKSQNIDCRKWSLLLLVTTRASQKWFNNLLIFDLQLKPLVKFQLCSWWNEAIAGLITNSFKLGRCLDWRSQAVEEILATAFQWDLGVARKVLISLTKLTATPLWQMPSELCALASIFIT